MFTNLYTEIGPERLRLLVNRFYSEVFSNDILTPLFSKSERTVIETKQFQFLSQFLGGPSLYSDQYGHPKMRMRHMPHKITEDAKNEWLICIERAIDSLEMEDALKVKLYQVFPKIAAHMVNS
jgi:hemoglobin|tara:strand:+ start:11478 stop:11846 length:369 start_codon:yes stop_codon:yes gene_type:complete